MTLHERGLVHGSDPAVHVLLGVGAEIVRPHPAVLRLRANHRVLIVNVGAHPCVARLGEEEREYQRGRERERERERPDWLEGWVQHYDSSLPKEIVIKN